MPGEYSPAGATSCSICPPGQYSPSYGLADQQVGNNGIHCLLCPRGSIALVGAESKARVNDNPIAADQSMNTGALVADDYRNELALSEGATFCDAW